MKLVIRKQDCVRDDNTTAIGTMEQDKDKIREKIKDQKDIIPVNGTITPQTGNRNDKPSIIKNPQEDNGSSRDKGKNGRDKRSHATMSTGPIPITTRGIPIHDGDME